MARGLTILIITLGLASIAGADCPSPQWTVDDLAFKAIEFKDCSIRELIDLETRVLDVLKARRKQVENSEVHRENLPLKSETAAMKANLALIRIQIGRR